MTFHKLSEAGAFSANCDLWIMADTHHSDWSRRVDWYLDLQVAYSKLHRVAAMPEKLKQIISDNEMEWTDLQVDKSSPLLLASHSRLPNKQTVELTYFDDKSDWVQRAYTIWANLNQPSLRLFLPAGFSGEELEKHWPAEPEEEIWMTYVAPSG